MSAFALGLIVALALGVLPALTVAATGAIPWGGFALAILVGAAIGAALGSPPGRGGR